MKKHLTIRVKQRDPQHNRWWNTCIGHTYTAKDNGTVYEIVDGSQVGNLISKSFAEPVNAK